MFKKEHRYFVFKIKDMTKYLTKREITQLETIADNLAAYRAADNKIDLECVVVESDWNCYTKVWELVEQEYNESIV